MPEPTKWFKARNMLRLSALQVGFSLFMSRLNALATESRILVNCIIYSTAYLQYHSGLVGIFRDLVDQRQAKGCGRGSGRQDQKLS
jgi:hypothetical protein